jgi:hypothetical protein
VLIDVVKMTSEGCFDVCGNMSRGLKRGRVEEIEWITVVLLNDLISEIIIIVRFAN